MFIFFLKDFFNVACLVLDFTEKIFFFRGHKKVCYQEMCEIFFWYVFFYRIPMNAWDFVLLIEKWAVNWEVSRHWTFITYLWFSCSCLTTDSSRAVELTALEPMRGGRKWKSRLTTWHFAFTSSVVGLIAAYSSLWSSTIKPSMSKNRMWLSASEILKRVCVNRMFKLQFRSKTFVGGRLETRSLLLIIEGRWKKELRGEIFGLEEKYWAEGIYHYFL